MHQFNAAMLAKQGWRLINEDNPFVSAVMKARYYPTTDFLSAKLGDNPSYMWRSIFSTQDIVKQGCRRRIGDGSSTFVWKVPWLPAVDNGMLTSNMPEELGDIKVQGLMKIGERKWDDEVLGDLFNDRDRELINKIPLPRSDKMDSWYWIFDEKGEFTVRSCYRKLRGECNSRNASFWRKIWSLKLPSKIVNFIWRACRACLPTAVDLLSKRVNIDSKCDWCKQLDEDGVHVLFECSFAKSVWEAVGLGTVLQISSNDSVLDVLMKTFAKCTKDQAVLIALFCWNIWNRRNKWVWDRINMSIFGTKTTALHLLADWKKAQQEGAKQKQGQSLGSRVWQVPPRDWKKINVDAAVIPGMKYVGIESVLRDEDGRFLQARCMTVTGEWSVKEAEAISLKEAMLWAESLGIKKCIFETDSKLLVDAYNGANGKSDFHAIVTDCVDSCQHFDNALVQFIYKSANAVAHTLARASHSIPGFHEWKGNAPEFILDVLSFDIS